MNAPVRALSGDEARGIVGEPEALARAKVTDHITPPFRRFITHSPFLAMATSDASGAADCSPRGDHPGFVRVLDERTLAVPDRLGNRLIDSFRNIAENPAVGLLFLVPGTPETLRVNGRAFLTDDPDVLVRMEAEGKVPQLALLVHVEEAFAHCGRAVLRSRLWEPESTRLAEEVPSMAEMLADQVRRLGVSAADVQAEVEVANRTLY